MDQTAQLVAAIAALWTILTGLAGGVIKWLVTDRKECDEGWEKRLTKVEGDWSGRVASLEGKLDAAGGVVSKQTDALQKQVEAQARLVESQAAMIEALRVPAGGTRS